VLQFGWPPAFALVGGSGFLWLVLWWSVYRTPPEVSKETAARPAPALSLLRTRFVWSFTLSKVFMDPVWYFYIFWFPEYLKTARGFDLAAIGKFAWIPFFAAGAGNLIGGTVSALLLRRGWAPPAARVWRRTIRSSAGSPFGWRSCRTSHAAGEPRGWPGRSRRWPKNAAACMGGIRY